MVESNKLTKFPSTLGFNPIPNRNDMFKNADAWLEGKQSLDGAEGFWRVYDGLYDLTDFVDQHPGGRFWLDVTKGIDVTEAFESHHISTKPESVLKKYFVRNAKIARNSPFTFDENGFYKTLKRNVRVVLDDVPKRAAIISKMITDGLLIGGFLFSVLASAYWSFTFAIIAGVFVAFTAICAHNYYHQKDNFRMYYSDVCLINSKELRIVHSISHHAFPNTAADMQAYVFEPVINLYPVKKSIWVKYGSWFYTPLCFGPILYYYFFIIRFYYWLFLGYSNSVDRRDFVPFILPLTMYLFGGQPLFMTIAMWLFIISTHSVIFVVIANGTTHYHPDIFMDGDTARPENERDWGIHQLDAVADKHEVTGSHFLTLITFGDHALHHLFPALDHGVLQYLYPVFEQTLKEFNLDTRVTTLSDLLNGFFKRLSSEEPNPNPPDLLKGKKLRYL